MKDSDNIFCLSNIGVYILPKEKYVKLVFYSYVWIMEDLRVSKILKRRKYAIVHDMKIDCNVHWMYEIVHLLAISKPWGRQLFIMIGGRGFNVRGRA